MAKRESQRRVAARMGGTEAATFYGRKAGAHQDRRTKRERTRSAVKAAAMRDYR